jgi:hypothetical protein
MAMINNLNIGIRKPIGGKANVSANQYARIAPGLDSGSLVSARYRSQPFHAVIYRKRPPIMNHHFQLIAIAVLGNLWSCHPIVIKIILVRNGSSLSNTMLH